MENLNETIAKVLELKVTIKYIRRAGPLIRLILNVYNDYPTQRVVISSGLPVKRRRWHAPIPQLYLQFI